MPPQLPPELVSLVRKEMNRRYGEDMSSPEALDTMHRLTTDPEYLARFAQEAQEGTLGWGGTHGLPQGILTAGALTPLVGAGLKGLGMTAAGGALGGPVGAGVGLMGALGLGGYGIANILEARDREQHGLPGTGALVGGEGFGQSGWGALDVAPLPFDMKHAARIFGGLRRPPMSTSLVRSDVGRRPTSPEAAQNLSEQGFTGGLETGVITGLPPGGAKVRIPQKESIFKELKPGQTIDPRPKDVDVPRPYAPAGVGGTPTAIPNAALLEYGRRGGDLQDFLRGAGGADSLPQRATVGPDVTAGVEQAGVTPQIRIGTKDKKDILRSLAELEGVRESDLRIISRFLDVGPHQMDPKELQRLHDIALDLDPQGGGLMQPNVVTDINRPPEKLGEPLPQGGDPDAGLVLRPDWQEQDVVKRMREVAGTEPPPARTPGTEYASDAGREVPVSQEGTVQPRTPYDRTQQRAKNIVPDPTISAGSEGETVIRVLDQGAKDIQTKLTGPEGLFEKFRVSAGEAEEKTADLGSAFDEVTDLLKTGTKVGRGGRSISYREIFPSSVISRLEKTARQIDLWRDAIDNQKHVIDQNAGKGTTKLEKEQASAAVSTAVRTIGGIISKLDSASQTLSDEMVNAIARIQTPGSKDLKRAQENISRVLMGKVQAKTGPKPKPSTQGNLF
tara:strand:- start:498 stop:2522 length:2025 start_codon:yes stop_codon:yes gene_type:complete